MSKIAKPISRPVDVLPGTSYRTIGVKWWGEGAYERETIDGSQTAAKTLSIVREGDLIINKIWVRHGSTAIAGKDVDGCAASGEFPTFALDLTEVLPRWLHWQTKTKEFWEKCDRLSQGTSGKNRIKPDLFLSIEIPLPLLEEQRRIVARVEELVGKIEEARSLRQQALEETKVLPNSELAAIFNRSIEKYSYYLLDELILEAGYGTSAKCNYERIEHSVPVLRIPNVASGRIELDDIKYGIPGDKELEKVLLEEEDVLVVRTNGSADLVGRCSVVSTLPEPTAFASYLIRLRCNRQIVDSDYLQLMLTHLRTDGQLFDLARTTAGQYNVSLGRLRSAKIPVPPLPEQRRIVTYLDNLQAKVEEMKHLREQALQELDALLPSILDKAFKGEL
ncbi:MAG TPA: restriction endonuclease subunit S [Candidatus Obscuribacterales bacterium]